ncbi:MAG TPA: hypothetical protein VH370_01820 [Humisphaera sp.]|jgi:hypothetical protein|nr:hypothetical protein [Humisphaera sp.]
MPANAEVDPFFELLTDALRAGPGSPQWRDAVAQLREKGAGEADEFRLLITTRESLESGREYRSVRAGAGFTQKVMGGLGDQKRLGATWPIANIVAIIGAAGILLAVGYVVYRVASPAGEADPRAIEQLSTDAKHYLNDISVASFSGALPDNWKQIGSLPLAFKGTMMPLADTANQGGGIYYANGISAQQGYMVETTIAAPTPNSAILLQVFVSADTSFSAERGTGAHEIAWSLEGLEQRVIVDGNVQQIARKASAGSLKVRLIVNHDLAIVEVGQRNADGRTDFQQVWAGAHHLNSGTHFAGVRFLRSAAGGASPAVESIHIARG